MSRGRFVKERDVGRNKMRQGTLKVKFSLPFGSYVVEALKTG